MGLDLGNGSWYTMYRCDHQSDGICGFISEKPTDQPFTPVEFDQKTEYFLAMLSEYIRGGYDFAAIDAALGTRYLRREVEDMKRQLEELRKTKP